MNHERDYGPAAKERAIYVDLYDASPAFWRQIHNCPSRDYTGIIYQDIDGSKALRDLLDSCADSLRVSDVEWNLHGLASVLTYDIRDVRGPLDVQQTHRRSFARKPYRDGSTDPARRAGDEGNFPIKPSHATIRSVVQPLVHVQ